VGDAVEHGAGRSWVILAPPGPAKMCAQYLLAVTHTLPSQATLTQVPVFYPTMDDMRGSFERYIESIEEQFAAAGICKIVPPKAWSPRKESYVRPKSLALVRWGGTTSGWQV
jgi:hypothetical protein